MFLKVDFENAFNSSRRDDMLKSVIELAPSLLPYVHSSYSSSSLLKDSLVCTARSMCIVFVLQNLMCCAVMLILNLSERHIVMNRFLSQIHLLQQASLLS